MDTQISKAGSLRGEITVPGDKSISHRAVMIGGISHGTTRISGFLHAADPLSTLACYRQMGISSEFTDGDLLVHGKGPQGLQPPSTTLDAGNSGTTMRLLSGILCGQKFPSIISGDEYLNKRPMKRIIDPLRLMGADISASDNFTAPLSITPSQSLKSITYELPIASAQVKSALLFAGIYAEGTTKIIERKASRDHTERMLGLNIEAGTGKRVISINRDIDLRAKEFRIPGDPSSAAFFIVASLLVPHSEVLIKNVGLNPTRIGYLEFLQKMGGRISILNKRTIGGEPIGDIAVRSSDLTTDLVINGDIIPNIIDEIPILAVAAAFSKGTFEIRDASELRTKETDRIGAICQNIRAMGAHVEEYQDGFAIESKNNLFPSEFDSFEDHRIAMAFGVAALMLQGTSSIKNAHCVDISFPGFWQLIKRLQQ